ncbi:site-specific integrase [Vicingus serpentipes]|uniref:Site-specific integrase n=1 Tax=Vicingus serpentipes TaxID=1926625 RepID=A0A5C6S0X3_9FLAO|nr:site-specific integrase [Vicingus serpentipes]TXB67252.1 site-specific integrase [Vicingus serpentipes]
MIAKAVFHQGKVKIHYQNKTRAKRINTGVTITSASEISKDGRLKSTVKDVERKQVIINKFKKDAQDLVDGHFHKHDNYPTGDEFNKLWSKRDNLLVRSERLLDFYDRFLAWKPKDRNIKKLSSLKDYNSLKKNLTDYESFLGEEIMLGDINKEWLGEFEAYLTGCKDDSYTSKTNHKLETRKKRIRTLKAFFNWMDESDLFTIPKALSNFKSEQGVAETVKAVLTKAEVIKLYKKKFSDPKKEFIKDVFVFTCYTGLRFSDLISLTKRHIKELDSAGTTIIKKAVKTGYEFSIPLNKVALEILELYDYDFSRYDNANFNKYLHILLKETEMFDDELDFEEEVKERWECLSIHRGRDTFITLLIQERVPLNEIMKYTGHRSVSNLNKYIDTKGELINYTKELI